MFDARWELLTSSLPTSLRQDEVPYDNFRSSKYWDEKREGEFWSSLGAVTP